MHNSTMVIYNHLDIFLNPSLFSLTLWNPDRIIGINFGGIIQILLPFSLNQTNLLVLFYLRGGMVLLT